MNTCVLILGAWFLQLDNGYDDVKFVKVDSIVSVEGDDRFPAIYTENHEITWSGWIPEKDRYMTAVETMELIKTCTE